MCDSKSLIQALATAIIVVDQHSTVSQVNAAAESLLAMSAPKLLGRALDEIFVAADELQRLLERVVRDEGTFTERDLELASTSLKSILVDCTVSSWLGSDADGSHYIIELVSVERHQRIVLEENMRTQNQATAALMRGLAHEVKNPLGGIRGAAQLLERALQDKSQTEYTQIIIGEADRLRALVDKMLGPHGAFDRVPVNIHDVLEHVRQLVLVEHGGELRLIRDYDPSLPEFLGDRDRLIQAFLNLARNAARALLGVKGTITIRTRAQRNFTIGDQVHRLVMRVDVVDNGPGVPPDIADRMFYPMVTGHADGTGLGLPLAQSIVNRQGGLIGYNADATETEFNVWLPLELGT